MRAISLIARKISSTLLNDKGRQFACGTSEVKIAFIIAQKEIM